MLRTVSSVRMLQALAAVLTLAIAMWTTGFPGNFMEVDAAAVTSVSDTITDSAPSTLSNHTIKFQSENGLAPSQTIEITFDPDTSAFTVPSLGVEDVDLATSTSVVGTWADNSIQAGASGAGVWGFTASGDTITLQAPTDWSVASDTAFQIEVGTNATFGTAGDSQITNPSATGSYPISIGGTMTDSGTTRIAVIENVTLTASVDTVFEFTVAGVAQSSSVNSSPTTTSTTTTSTAIPFGTLTAASSSMLAQDLSVTTNAANGFTVTVEQSGNLLSSTGADIDGFADGAYTSTPSPWQGPSATIGQENTYGHWGLTSDDPDFSATADRWVAASTTPVTIFQNTSVSDGTQTGTGTTRVGYQIEISALQEAGDDYSTTLTYIATPTF